jgi:demethylmenaquinone methyltransferase / 2-methoxy-6-polyprenyl-1,4-benzoquinol methylase
MPDPNAVNSMFGRIAPRYDLANRVLSAGIDTYWRFNLVRAVRHTGSEEILDLATGSGDVAYALARGLGSNTHVLGMDFCTPMLVQAEAKRSSHPANAGHIQFQQGDALALPFKDYTFDAVTIAFGLRNMADRALCLTEILRVLKPGGRLFVLEFSQPTKWVRPFYYFHMRRVAPFVAGLLTGDRSAYEYLCTSIEAFPGRERLSEEIRAAGFSLVSATAMTFGVVALHVAVRAPVVS